MNQIRELCHASAHGRPDARVQQNISVVLVIDDLGIGGAQRLLEVQLRAMKNGPYSIHVVNLSRSTAASDRIRQFGIEVSDIDQHGLFDRKAWSVLRRLLDELRPEVIHAHLTHATIIGALLSKVLGTRFVVTLHSQGPDACGWRGRTKTLLERVVLTYGTDHVLACGPRVARMQAKRLGRTPVTIVENRIEAPAGLSPAERANLRSSLGYGPDDMVVISVGRLIPGKGFDRLIRAFGSVVAQHRSARLLIVGGGGDHSRLTRVIEETGSGPYVQMTGARSDVGRLMAAADVFVLPSLWEGLPMTLLEAMASGLPVVATDVGDIATVLRAGAGILIKPGDEEELRRGLNQVLGSAELRGELIAEEKRAVRRYTDLDGFSKELQAVYFRAN